MNIQQPTSNSQHPMGKLDLGLARECVRACGLAYQTATIESPLAHVLVQRGEDYAPAIIAFRGSASRCDWMTDARIGFADVGVGRVHRGFWESTQSVIEQVRRMDQRAAPTAVVVTGHSKGAAEAIICAWLLTRSGLPVRAVVTFGGPRMGDADWRRNYDQVPIVNRRSQIANGKSQMEEGKRLGDVTWRWVHEEDIVPRWPLWWRGYRHVGQEVFMPSLGMGVRVRPALWFKVFSDLVGMYRDYRFGKLAPVVDHSIEEYQEEINTL